MRRREFIAGLGSAAAWPVVVRAQQAAMPVVAFFSAGSRENQGHFAVAFLEGLREQGFIEGQNFSIEYRYANDQYDLLPAIAAELVQRRVALIAATPRAVDAAKTATSTIPIVFRSS
jgi:putative ABC transport system substrate-binding protein